MSEKPKPQRGLSSINEARALRQSRSQPTASSKFWLWSLIAIVAISIFYWKKTQTENDSHRALILAKQRGIAAELGPMYTTLRGKVERWSAETARGGFEPDFVSPKLRESAKGTGQPPLFKHPGLYLRSSQTDARTPEALQVAAQESLRDAFTACLLHTPHLGLREGVACKKSKECKGGEICNEAGICSKPSQPFNMRVAYRGLRILSDSWVRSVETTNEPLTLRLFDGDIDDAVANDIPVAIDLLRQAEYFLVVLDELPEGLKIPAGASVEQSIQSEVHPTRVALYDIKSSELLLRVHRTIDVSIPAVPGDAATMDAQRRQILNCALAQDVRQAIAGE
jgi:hypothetical protein